MLYGELRGSPWVIRWRKLTVGCSKYNITKVGFERKLIKLMMQFLQEITSLCLSLQTPPSRAIFLPLVALVVRLSYGSKSTDAMEDDYSNGIIGSGNSGLPITSLRFIGSSSNISLHPTQAHPIAIKGHKESVYALTMNDDGSLFVSGGTKGVTQGKWKFELIIAIFIIYFVQPSDA
ncbi:hypothetical protein NE237_008976 [Protea cynaroides]|uniref:Uncharacterized protein n=1 Tax=Protea cynaroides TaxID=273540 RepID=A0A9Q0KXG9_9MAGN|nr:hypothetical protein NE237_008976 [Protea cynaroides]